jgi:osmoprotectant transport system permease protein
MEPRPVIVADQFRPGTFIDAFRFIGDHGSLLLTKTGEHLELSFAALGIGLLLALPLGLWLGHRHRGFFFAATVSNVGRALPSLVLIAFGLTIFGVGFWNNTAALVVLAIPPILTNAYFAIDGVDRDVVEAARGMGLSERQVLMQVELPLGLPLVIAGVRISTIFVIATATIAAVAGGGGLGEIIVNQASYGLAGVVGASLCVSALTLLAALGLGLLRRALSPSPVPGA